MRLLKLKSILTVSLSILCATNMVTASAYATTPLQAQSFTISSQIYIDGKLVSSPKIIAHPDQKALVTIFNKANQDKLTMALIASNTDNQAINLSYDIQYHLGNSTIHVAPKLIVLAKQYAAIRLTSAGHLFEMKVHATDNK